MTSVFWARAVIIAILLLPFLWDWYVVARNQPDLIITEQWFLWGRTAPWLYFILGFLVSHVIWPHIVHDGSYYGLPK